MVIRKMEAVLIVIADMKIESIAQYHPPENCQDNFRDKDWKNTCEIRGDLLIRDGNYNPRLLLNKQTSKGLRAGDDICLVYIPDQIAIWIVEQVLFLSKGIISGSPIVLIGEGTIGHKKYLQTIRPPHSGDVNFLD
jgi:hypothetical protein